MGKVYNTHESKQNFGFCRLKGFEVTSYCNLFLNEEFLQLPCVTDYD